LEKLLDLDTIDDETCDEVGADEIIPQFYFGRSIRNESSKILRIDKQRNHEQARLTHIRDNKPWNDDLTPEQLDDQKKLERESRAAVRQCSVAECRGFLKKWKCGACDRTTCSQCLEVKEAQTVPRTSGKGTKTVFVHTCDEEAVANAKFIHSNTKTCPKCGTHIGRISGCDQMWCTQCHTTFSWRTNEVLTGVVHNPHFFHWKNNGRKPAEIGKINEQAAQNCCHVDGFTGHGIEWSRFHWFMSHHFPDDKDSIKWWEDLFQTVTHLVEVELPRYRKVAEPFDTHALRRNYIVKSCTEKNFSTQVIRMHRKMSKSRDILHVIELVQTVLIDVIRTASQHLERLISLPPGKDAVIMASVYEAVCHQQERARGVRSYANLELNVISVLYQQMCPQFQPNTRGEPAHEFQISNVRCKMRLAEIMEKRAKHDASK